jgi:Na+-driven multidrug efflux pump
MSFFGGVTQGAQSLVAAADGSNDRERIRRAGGAGILIGLITGLIAFVMITLIY